MRNPLPENIQISKAELERGNLVAIPTETVYGLAANGLDTSAVIKIFEAKNRPYFDPLILHTNSIQKVKLLVKEFPEKAMMLAEKFWPGPLTILLPKSDIIPDIVTSGLPHVAIRIPAHPLTLQLLESVDFPLAAPSANPFGYVSPTTADHVRAQLHGKLNYILDGGPCKIGLESTIVGFEKDEVIIQRLGGLEIEEIEKAIGNVIIRINSSGDPKAPGQLKSHYATKTKIISGNIETLLDQNLNKNFGVISFRKKYSSKNNIVLSDEGNLSEAAQNLFSAMREMDEKKLELIIIEVFPNEFLGRAINDRIRRASA
ncbi:MAG: L-threonylcarbamoyladenylate synthase [Bacteroidota bacterium]|jgi:L-threonylcarbamoyladenylate synthase